MGDDSDGRGRVIMAAVRSGRRVGVAYHDAREAEINVMESSDGTEGDFSFMRHAIFHAKPLRVHLPKASEEAFVHEAKGALQDLRDENDEDLNEATGYGNNESPDERKEEKLEALGIYREKWSLFDPKAAQKTLEMLSLLEPACGQRRSDHANDDEDQSRETLRARLQALAARISFDREQQVAAASALVNILLRTGELHVSEGAGAKRHAQDRSEKHSSVSRYIAVNNVKEVSLEDYLTLDGASYTALAIFSEERHPSHFVGKAKEGLSVFGTFNRCDTHQGKRLLRQWFERPLLDRKALEDRLQSTEYFKGRKHLRDALRHCVRGAKDTQLLLKKLSSISEAHSATLWREVTSSLSAFLSARDCIESQLKHEVNRNEIEHIGVIRRVLASVTRKILEVHELISGVVDLEVGGTESGELVQWGVANQLDEKRTIFNSLDDFLTEVARTELQRLPSHLLRRADDLSLAIIYQPKVGYLVKISGGKPGADLLEALPDYSFVFEGDFDGEGHAFFFRSQRTHELDEKFGDLFHDIVDLESAILMDLRRRVGEYTNVIARAGKSMAELDCIIALATAASEHDLHRPALAADSSLEIHDGRHLLQEQTVNSFVPNSVAIDQHSRRINIIGGPNASGKTVLITMVGIIVFLANVGCFVPASGALVPVVDRIFTRMNTRESINQPLQQSAFMRDLTQMGNALRHATTRSLLLVDEFGKGTSSADGLSLLASAISYLDRNFDPPPATFVATHFRELSNERILRPTRNIAFQYMRVVAERASPDQDSIVFLFQLAPGAAPQSFGYNCARLAGLPEHVLNRIKEVLRAAANGRALGRTTSEGEEEHARFIRSVVGRLRSYDIAKEDPIDFLTSLREAHADALKRDPSKAALTS